MKLKTLNNCVGCSRAPCIKEWPEDRADEARRIIREEHTCLKQGASVDEMGPIYIGLTVVGVEYVIEIHEVDGQPTTLDLWIPNNIAEIPEIRQALDELIAI